jgi:CRP/FNR family transcriptional regulator, cyclic AMP receptor protein
MAVRDHPLPLPSRAVPAWVLRAPGASPRSLGAGASPADESRQIDGDLIAVTRGAVALGCTSLTGRTAVLAILGPGDAIGPRSDRPGARAGDGDGPRLELRALVPSEVVRVPAAGLRLACARDPSAAPELALLVARQAEVLSRRLELALTANVVERVHRTLLELAAAHGIRRRGGLGVEIGLPLTQDLVAALVGATRESVNRALRVLGQRGQVARREGRYVLPGPS